MLTDAGNGMGLMKDGPASEIEAIETTFDERTEEGSMKVEFDIKVEETLDIKEENSEGITSPTINAVPEEYRARICTWHARVALRSAVSQFGTRGDKNFLGAMTLCAAVTATLLVIWEWS